MAEIKQFKTQVPAWLLIIRDDFEEAYFEIWPTARDGHGSINIYARNWNEANNLRNQAEKEFKTIHADMIRHHTTIQEGETQHNDK